MGPRCDLVVAVVVSVVLVVRALPMGDLGLALYSSLREVEVGAKSSSACRGRHSLVAL
jgi:hypothetical protein